MEYVFTETPWKDWWNPGFTGTDIAQCEQEKGHVGNVLNMSRDILSENFHTFARKIFTALRVIKSTQSSIFNILNPRKAASF